jgi:hypothetical protein
MRDGLINRLRLLHLTVNRFLRRKTNTDFNNNVLSVYFIHGSGRFLFLRAREHFLGLALWRAFITSQKIRPLMRYA